MVAVADRTIEPWTDAAAVTALGGAGSRVDADTVAWLIKFVSHKMWDATGRRFGVIESSARPVRTCVPKKAVGEGYLAGVPMSSIARIDMNHDAGCGCLVPALELRGPIQSVTSWSLDGVAMPLANLHISPDRRWLWLLDGTTWPCSQDLSVDPATVRTDPERHAWKIDHVYGRPIPSDGAAVAALLVDHYASMLPGPCSLPTGLVKLQRQGVTMDFAKDATGENVGLDIVDEWLRHADRRRRRGGRARLARLTPVHQKLSWRYPDA